MAAPLGLMSAGDEELFSSGDEGAPPKHSRGLPFGHTVTETFMQTKYEGKKEELEGYGNDVTTEVAVETGFGEDKVMPSKVSVCPELLIGPRFVKALKLHAGQWMRIGRDKESAVLLDNVGVSRKHCSVRWDSKNRIVQFRDTSTSGTMVNGQVVRSDQLNLLHGFHLRIEGKSCRYEFILDLRPVGLALTDPRTVTHGPGEASRSHVSKREHLRAEILQLQALNSQKETDIFTQEKKFYEMVSQSMQRDAEYKENQEKLQHFIKEIAALENKLAESRAEWLDKLKEEYAANEEDSKPVIEATKQVHDRLAKLEMKKNELERSIYPHRFAVADLPQMAELPPPSENAIGARSGDVDGEDEAFPSPMPSPAGSTDPARKDDKTFSIKDAEPQFDLHPDEIFGAIEADITAPEEDDDEPLVKKPRVD